MRANAMTELSQTESEKLRRLRDIVGDMPDAVVAFSGGVDSTLVLRIAMDELGPERVVAVTVRTPFVPDSEIREARSLAQNLGASHHEIEIDVLQRPKLAHNPPQRCYWCKRTILTRLRQLAEQEGFRVVADGTNQDEAEHERRPGLKALEELEVRSPLREAGLRKNEIRGVSRHLGLPTHDQPSGSCLATRFPYGTNLTTEKLERVERGEEVLRKLGFETFRVRCHDALARIELARAEMEALCRDRQLRATVVERLRSVGFVYVTLDLQGYRSGSMDEPLGVKKGGNTTSNSQSH